MGVDFALKLNFCVKSTDRDLIGQIFDLRPTERGLFEALEEFLGLRGLDGAFLSYKMF